MIGSLHCLQNFSCFFELGYNSIFPDKPFLILSPAAFNWVLIKYSISCSKDSEKSLDISSGTLSVSI